MDSFDDRYLGSKTSNPTLDNDGNALVTGALYYNSTDGEMRVYDGSQWIAASAASQAILTKYKYVATAGQTTFSGTDANSLTLTYTVGSIIVTLNGVVLNGTDYTATTGTSVVLSVAASLNDELNVHAFSTFDVANTYTQAQVDAFAVKLTGDQTVAGVKTFSGATTVMNGNVGIGTSSPQSTFQVGSINSGTSEATNKGLVVIQSAPSTVDTAGGLEFKTSSSGSGYGWKIGGLNAAGDPFVIGNRANSATFTERARIDSSGSLLVGTTSATFGGVTLAQLLDARTRNSGFGLGIIGNASNTQPQRFFYDTTAVGSINITSSTTSYITSSDYRLKNTVIPMTGALAKVAALNPCTYKWNIDGSDGQGFIAHELQAVVPDCVTGEKDAVDADGNPQYQGIDTSFLVATLTAAIQEQQAQIEQLKADVAALKGQA